MKALLGCAHCGKTMRRLRDVDLADCPECGRPLQEFGLAEAHGLQRERRIAERFGQGAGRRGRLPALGDAPAAVQRLRDVRMFFQHASEKEFCEVIERLMSRRVRAFVNGVDTNVDVSTEVFHLEPEAAEPAFRQEPRGSR